MSEGGLSGEGGGSKGSSESGVPNLITFFITDKQNQEQKQEAARQGKATSSQIYSKSEEKGVEFSDSEDFWFCILVLTCLIRDWIRDKLSVSEGSIELSIFL